MTTYYIIFFIISTCALFEIKQVRKNQRFILLIHLVVLLSIIAGFRYQEGALDFEVYKEAYSDIYLNGLNYNKYTSSAALFEPGFVFILFLCSLFSSSPHLGFLTIALIAIGINLKCYYTYSPKFFLFATLFYFIHTFLLRDMTLIRSGVAAAFVLYSIRYIETRQLKKFMFTIFIAMTFHLASGIFIFTYFFYKKRWERNTWVYIIILCLIIAYIMPFGRLIQLLPKTGVLTRITNYTWMLESAPLGVLTNPTVLKQLFFTFISLKYYEVLNKKIPHFNVLLVPYMISVCWLMVWNDFPIIAARLATFFSVTEILIIPSILVLVNKQSRPFLAYLLILLALLILFMNGNHHLKNVPGLLPYKFVLFN